MEAIKKLEDLRCRVLLIRLASLKNFCKKLGIELTNQDTKVRMNIDIPRLDDGEINPDGWRTLENGTRINLSESGEILAGMGGKYTGQNIAEIGKDRSKPPEVDERVRKLQELDRLKKKISANGYDSLTDEEKEAFFDISTEKYSLEVSLFEEKLQAGELASREELVALLDSNPNLSQEYKDAIMERLDNGTELGQALYANFVWEGNVKDTDASRTAHYRPGVATAGIFVNEEYDLNNPRGNASAFLHEQGHAIHLRGMGSEARTIERDLERAAVEDFEALRNNAQNAKLTDRRFMNNLEREFSVRSGLSSAGYVRSSASDITEGVTARSDVNLPFFNARERGGFGHGSSYWERQGSLGREIFAHVFEAQFDSRRMEALRSYYPQTVERFEEIARNQLMNR